MSNSRKPMSGFIASILNLILVIILINVIVILTTAESEGKKLNYTTVVVEQVHDIWTDAKEAWTSKNDTIK